MDDTNKVIGLSLIGLVGIMVIYTIIMNTWQIKNWDYGLSNIKLPIWGFINEKN